MANLVRAQLHTSGYKRTIREYIENQRWDDDGESLKITSPTVFQPVVTKSTS
jgi:hypothetical protein